jgi:hypothetical protein
MLPRVAFVNRHTFWLSFPAILVGVTNAVRSGAYREGVLTPSPGARHERWGIWGYIPSRTYIPLAKTGWGGGGCGNFFHVVKNFSEKPATFFFCSPQLADLRHIWKPDIWYHILTNPSSGINLSWPPPKLNLHPNHLCFLIQLWGDFRVYADAHISHCSCCERVLVRWPPDTLRFALCSRLRRHTVRNIDILRMHPYHRIHL